MKVLVTGASGFLGSHLCRRLAEAEHRVRAFCRPTSNLSRLGDLSCERATGDVTEAAAVRAAVEGCDAVIHAAADVDYWRENPERQRRTNIGGTRNVAQACRAAGVRRLVHVSSVGAVGITEDPAHPADESFVFNLQEAGLPYHVSKGQAEREVLAEVERGLDAVIVNPSSIMAPRHVAQLQASVRRASIVPCYSGGNCIVHPDDVVSGIMAALASGRTGERYILGGENLTFRALSEKAATVLGLQRRFVTIPSFVTGVAALVLEPWAHVTHRPPRISHMVHYCANRFMFYDSSKARRELGYDARDVNTILMEALTPPAASPSRAEKVHAG